MSSEHAEHPEPAEHGGHGEDKAAYDDINIRSLALVGGVGALLVFVAIVAVQVVYFRYDRAEHLRKIVNVPFVSAEASLANQRERISTPGEGAFPEKGEKSIPIDEAMTLIVASYQQRQQSDAEEPGATESAAEGGSAASGQASSGAGSVANTKGADAE